MKLVPIPKEKYDQYKIDAIFDCYKWDPQFLDNNTLSKYVLVLTEKEAKEVAKLTEQLDLETRQAEEYIIKNLKIAKKLLLPSKIIKEIRKMSNYNSKNNIRLTRYDFHPTANNKWVVSEVNSDVPGGFAEASLLPKLAIQVLNIKDCYSIDFGANLASIISSKIPPKGNIMFVHCTSYSDDRQVMQYIGDKMEENGFNSIYGAVDHVEFKDKKAFCILNGYNCNVDLIFRFTPLEWLIKVKPKTWDGYFDTLTPSCNHPISMFAQTKRFPLIWDDLEKQGISLTVWKKLLPKTTEVKNANGNYIYKPACGRVGEKISIKEACSDKEYKEILKDVSMHPKKYIAQEKFISKPIKGLSDKLYHVCLGSYAIDGKHAGFYARISDKPRIDSSAEDIPVIIKRDKI